MTSSLKIKRSDTGGNPAVLGAGELAYSSLADNGSNGGDRLYIGAGTETSGNAVNHVVIGGKYFTDMLNASTNLNTASTLVKRDASGNFAANIISAALSGNATTATAWQTARNLSLTGDASATLSGVDGTSAVSAAVTLATVNSNVGSYGSTVSIPVITVNGKGLVTSVSTATISTSLTINGDTGSDVVDTGILTFTGGTGVTTAISDNTATFSIGQAVATTSSPTFNNLTVNGVFTSNDITSTNISIDGNATITGNLTVQGTTTTVNSTAVAITDVNLTLAKDATTAAAANGAGLTIAGPATPATFTYTSSNDHWNLNKNLTVANVYGNLIGAVTGNADTASKWATARDLSLTGDATATLASVDGSTAVSTAITLATVNSNVGSYGSTTAIPVITVNAKGLVTGVSTQSISTAFNLYGDSGVISVGGNDSVTIEGRVGVLTEATAGHLYIDIGQAVGTTDSVTFSNVTASLTGNASTATKWATARNLSLTGDATATLTSVDGSAAVSAALTLATVNTNVGSYGTSTTIPAVTVNAKGLVTAITTSAIPTATTAILGLASFDSGNFTVSSGSVTLTAVDGGTY